MVSWYETAQFCNYLTSGDKSLGAYLFSNGDFTGIDRDSAVSAYGIAYVIPTEDEWYKAAYYKPDGSGYSLYASGTNTAPTAGDESNYGSVNSAPWDVGTGAEEQNGTFDMMGNVNEWIGSGYVFRGGSYGNSNSSYLASSYRNGYSPAGEDDVMGFRVASVPEPATLLLLSLGGLFLRRRK